MMKLHLTPMDFADLCGVHRVQVWRWCAGKVPTPQYAWTILALIEGVQYQEILGALPPESAKELR